MRVDLNADLGESYGRWRLGDDETLLGLITSANVACGFHAGDPRTLLDTCRSAVARGVIIGAQVGYHDLAGFGRRAIEVPGDELIAETIYQIGALDGLARSVGGRVRYVKPHGALYHAVNRATEQRDAVLDAVVAVSGQLAVVGMPDSPFLRAAAERGLTTVREFFVDRGYTADGQLIDRRSPGALITDPVAATAAAVEAVRTGRYDTLCVHGDSPEATTMARAVRDGLRAAGITVGPPSG